MPKKLIILSLTFLLIYPLITSAISFFPAPWESEFWVWGAVNGIVNFLWPMFIGIAIIMFIISGYLFLSSNGEPGKVNLAKQALIWGIIGVIVAFLSTSIVWIVGEWVGV